MASTPSPEAAVAESDSERFAVPTIRLDGWWSHDRAAREAVAKQVGRACRDVGFFKIADHRIDPEVIAQLQETTSAFFELPLEEKLRYVSAAPEINRGYSEMGSEALSYSVGLESPPDLFEAFNIGVQNHTIDPSTLEAHHAVLYHDNIWPETVPGMRGAWQAYVGSVNVLAQEMLRIFAVALDLDVEYFAARAEESPDVLRSLRYVREHGAPDPIPGQMRLGAHSDYGMCTILLSDPVPGLQILTPDDEWLDVLPTDDTFIVNIGDMLAAWTNDRWRSTVHRVVPPDASLGRAERRSWAYFHEATPTALVEPLPSCVDEAHPARYEPMTAGDHLHGKIISGRGMQRTESALTTADRSDAIRT